MNVISILNIKKYFINDEHYKDFINVLSFHMKGILSTYSFLDLSEEEWMNIIGANINEEAISLIGILIEEIKNSLSLYINNEIASLNTRIVCNLLYKNANNYKSLKDILEHFKKDLDTFNIKISLEFYDKLKAEPIFRMLFKGKSISYEDFVKLVSLDANLYYEFFDFSRDILWTIKEVDNILDIISKKISRITLNDKRTIKFILDFYDSILKIEKYLKEHNINMTKNDFIKTLFSFSYEELNSFKNELISFDEAKPMPEFLSKIYRKFANLKELYERFPLKEGETEEQRKVEIDSIIESKLSLERREAIHGYLNGELSREESKIYNIIKSIKRHYLGKTKEHKSFYERFPLKEGKSAEDRKKEVDDLINKLTTKDEKELLADYLENKLADTDKKHKARIIIKRLQYYYSKGIKRLNPKTFYDRFPLNNGITKKSRQEKVDSLIAKILTEEEKKILDDYIAKKLKNDDDKKKAKRIVTRLQYHYENDRTHEFKRKLYERFPLKQNETEEIRKEKINLLIKIILEDEERDILFKYLNKEVSGNLYKDRVKNIISKLKKYYLGEKPKKVILIVLEYCNWKTDVSEEKFDLLFRKLKLIEYRYKVSKGLPNFEDFSQEVLSDIISHNVIFTFESLINEYVLILTSYLKKEDIRTNS